MELTLIDNQFYSPVYTTLSCLRAVPYWHAFFDIIAYADDIFLQCPSVKVIIIKLEPFHILLNAQDVNFFSRKIDVSGGKA